MNSEKHKTYVVGGAVRDRLLGRPVLDLDLVCRQAKPAARAAARRQKGTLVVLDEQNKIYRVVLKTGEFKTLDFAEMQGKTIEDDLARRDFTINAIAVPTDQYNAPVGTVPTAPFESFLDPFGGRRDLKGKILRAVSKKAFSDDPLRRLRAFRFMSQLGFRIEPQTLRWLSEGSMKGVAGERIRHELLLLAGGPHAGTAFRTMDKSGLLTELLPALEASRRTAVRYYGRGGVLEHALASVEAFETLQLKSLPALSPRYSQRIAAYLQGLVAGHPRASILKLACLLHDVGKPATAKMMKGRLRFFEHEHVGAEDAYKALDKLRFSRQECLLGRSWVKNHMRLGNLAAAPRTTEKAVARYFRDLGEDGIGMLLLSLADHWTYLKPSLWAKGRDPVEKTAMRMLDVYLGEKEKILPARLVNGNDLMRALRIKPGPLIGALLLRVADAQVGGKVATKEEAIRTARAALKSLSKRYPNRPA